ncbi:MAG: FliM/FliN family flagellar motor switch protein [Candidatus Binataceae bacterium]
MSEVSNTVSTTETEAARALVPGQNAEGPVASPGAGSVDLGVLRQVPMTVQVEVGRTTMTLGEILDELEVGASIRLDRHAGDPVEVYVNGALFARAEVVILQDQIGARLLEIVANGQDMRPSGLR